MSELAEQRAEKAEAERDALQARIEALIQTANEFQQQRDAAEAERDTLREALQDAIDYAEQDGNCTYCRHDNTHDRWCPVNKWKRTAEDILLFEPEAET